MPFAGCHRQRKTGILSEFDKDEKIGEELFKGTIKPSVGGVCRARSGAARYRTTTGLLGWERRCVTFQTSVKSA